MITDMISHVSLYTFKQNVFIGYPAQILDCK